MLPAYLNSCREFISVLNGCFNTLFFFLVLSLSNKDKLKIPVFLSWK